MKPTIAGEYLWGEEAVRIERAGQRTWQTTYSATSDSTWERLPIFRREYLVELPHDCSGIAQFDGKQLAGFFQSGTLPLALFKNSLIIAKPYAGGPLLFGKFIAVLRDDGNFDVVIEQYDGNSGPSKPKRILFEPELERTETVWVKQ